MLEFDWGLGALIAAYAVLAIVLMSLHIYSRWHPVIKAGVTLLLVAGCFVAYRSYPALLGWPIATERLPSRLFLLGLEISEPDNIYLWARDLDAGLGPQRPRAYDLPYSKTLHEEAAKAGQQLRRGIKVVVEIDPATERTLIQKDSGLALTKENSVRFVVAPEGLLPRKE